MGTVCETCCPNCGKPIMQYLLQDNPERKFCNRKCWKEYQEKKKAAKKADERPLTPAKTPPEQCKKCRYGCGIGDLQGCGYFDDPKRHSRHFLHPGGLPDECQEFEPRKRGRPKKI